MVRAAAPKGAEHVEVAKIRELQHAALATEVRGLDIVGEAGKPLDAGKHLAGGLRLLDVDELIDHPTQQFGIEMVDVDEVMDLVGGFGNDVMQSSLLVIKWGGTLVRVAPGTPEGLAVSAHDRGIHLTPEILVEPDHAGLLALASLADAGKLHVEVEKVYSVTQLAEAHRHGQRDRTQGKLVVTL